MSAKNRNRLSRLRSLNASTQLNRLIEYTKMIERTRDAVDEIGFDEVRQATDRELDALIELGSELSMLGERITRLAEKEYDSRLDF